MRTLIYCALKLCDGLRCAWGSIHFQTGDDYVHVVYLQLMRSELGFPAATSHGYCVLWPITAETHLPSRCFAQLFQTTWACKHRSLLIIMSALQNSHPSLTSVTSLNDALNFGNAHPPKVFWYQPMLWKHSWHRFVGIMASHLMCHMYASVGFG